MTNKSFLSFLVTLAFFSLVACGGSDSKSSAEQTKSKFDQKIGKVNNQVTQACDDGDNQLKEGESCFYNSNTYHCNKGKITVRTSYEGNFDSETPLDLGKIKLNCM